MWGRMESFHFMESCMLAFRWQEIKGVVTEMWYLLLSGAKFSHSLNGIIL